jgi:hypothetical protein
MATASARPVLPMAGPSTLFTLPTRRPRFRLLLVLTALLAAMQPLPSSGIAQAAVFEDDFNDNIIDATKWGTQLGTAGMFQENFGELKYNFLNTTIIGSRILPWQATELPWDRDWTVKFETFISCTCQQPDEYFAFGLLLSNTADFLDQLELAAFDETGANPGFRGAMRTNGTPNHDAGRVLGNGTGTLLLEFDSATKVVTMTVGRSTGGTFNPIVVDLEDAFGTFGTNGSGGATANANWGMGPGSTFTVGVFGNVVMKGTFLTSGVGELFRLTIDDPPVAVDDAFTTIEGISLAPPAPGVLTNDFDPESSPLTAVPVLGPLHASSFALSANGSFNYQPIPGFRGIDTFLYRASDGASESNDATVSIGVGAHTTGGDVVTVEFDASIAGVDPLTVTFQDVTTSGVTTVVPIDPDSVEDLPDGFIVLDGMAFEISSSASFAAPVEVCFTLPDVDDATLAALTIFHGEGDTLVDRTVRPPDFETGTICALVDSLSPFVVALDPTSVSTTTTLPSSGCGDANGGGLTASDALFALQSAVGLRQCAACLCDADGNGAVGAADALRILRAAVGQSVALLCPLCS